jgi:hypothetical protein
VKVFGAGGGTVWVTGGAVGAGVPQAVSAAATAAADMR